jgi:uncharacterized membrane protein
VDARSRLALSAAFGVVVFIPLFIFAEWQVALLAGWDATAAVFVLSVYLTTRGADSSRTSELARKEDDSRVVAEAILVGASIFSLVGVVFALLAARGMQRDLKTGITAVVVVSVLFSWAAVHTIFMLRYARLYYAEDGGINFHTDDAPDYTDFLYVALTLGMTFQVSDTDLTSRAIRRTALQHALLSYMFGVAIFATTINIVATLLTS